MAYLIVDKPSGSTRSTRTASPIRWPSASSARKPRSPRDSHRRHWDHVVDVSDLAERVGAPVPGPRLSGQGAGDVNLTEGNMIVAHVRSRPIRTPGHCADHTALKMNDTDCLTADVIFKGTVGGTMAPKRPGSATSTLDLGEADGAAFPAKIIPTTAASTISDEVESNPFVRVWRGLDDKGTDTCTVGRPTPRSAAKRRSCSGRPTTTEATRPGSHFADSGGARSSAARRMRKRGCAARRKVRTPGGYRSARHRPRVDRLPRRRVRGAPFPDRQHVDVAAAQDGLT